MRQLFLAGAVCLLLAACAPHQPLHLEVMPEIQNETFILRNLPWLKEVSTHDRILASGFKQVAVLGRSDSRTTRKAYVKVDWFTEDGFPVKTRLSRWKPVTIQPQEAFVYSAVSPSGAAVNYHVLITDELRDVGQRPHRNRAHFTK